MPRPGECVTSRAGMLRVIMLIHDTECVTENRLVKVRALSGLRGQGTTGRVLGLYIAPVYSAYSDYTLYTAHCSPLFYCPRMAMQAKWHRVRLVPRSTLKVRIYTRNVYCVRPADSTVAHTHALRPPSSYHMHSARRRLLSAWMVPGKRSESVWIASG